MSAAGKPLLSVIGKYASFVKFAHTVFALPFAIVGFAAALSVPQRSISFEIGDLFSFAGGAGFPEFSWRVLGFVLLAMVGARSFAMALNRIIDRRIDARNDRTKVRELPSGKITLPQAWTFTLVFGGLYFFACANLGDVVLTLSPIPPALMVLYPFTKRFTAACHLLLGVTLGLAPVGAWVAVRAGGRPLIGDVEIPGLEWDSVTELLPWLLGAAVALWVAGFDVIYALQDDKFDRDHKLHSIPARFGREKALLIARGFHVVSAVLFFVFTWLAVKASGGELSGLAWAAPALMALGMAYQHTLVKPRDLSRVDMAFFTVNGIVSVAFGLLFVIAAVL